VDYQIIEVSPHLSGVFPTSFRGDMSEVVAIHWRGRLYAGTGKVLAEDTSLPDFCSSLGIKPAEGKPKKGHKDTLYGFRDEHFPRKGKKKAPKKPSEPPKELTPAQKRERLVLDALKGEFRTKGSGGGDRDDRGGRGGRGGRGKPRNVIFLVEDKHGKDAESTYQGKGVFAPFTPREGGGTKTLARNRWAARQLTERFHVLDGEMLAAELYREDAAKTADPSTPSE